MRHSGSGRRLPCTATTARLARPSSRTGSRRRAPRGGDERRLRGSGRGRRAPVRSRAHRRHRPLGPSTAAAGGPVARVASAARRIAIASGPAFTFMLPGQRRSTRSGGRRDRRLRSAASTTRCLDVARRRSWSAVAFRRSMASSLAANQSLLDGRPQSGSGPGCRRGPSAVDCFGWRPLARRTSDGRRRSRPEAALDRRLILGYRTRPCRTVHSPLGPAGTFVRGHEFHYSSVAPDGRRARSYAARFGSGLAGFATPRCWPATCTSTWPASPRSRKPSCAAPFRPQPPALDRPGRPPTRRSRTARRCRSLPPSSMCSRSKSPGCATCAVCGVLRSA